MNPSPLRISTMTVTGHLGYVPDLTKLFDCCSFIPYWWVGEGVIKLQYGDKFKGICSDDILHTSTKTKKRFFNQSSLVFRILYEGAYKETNIKLFKNGGFQMTGISSEAMARVALDRLIEMNYGRGCRNKAVFKAHGARCPAYSSEGVNGFKCSFMRIKLLA